MNKKVEIYITNKPTYLTRSRTKVGVYTPRKFESNMAKPWQLKLDGGEFLVDTNGQVLTMKDWYAILTKYKIIEQ